MLRKGDVIFPSWTPSWCRIPSYTDGNFRIFPKKLGISAPSASDFVGFGRSFGPEIDEKKISNFAMDNFSARDTFHLAPVDIFDDEKNEVPGDQEFQNLSFQEAWNLLEPLTDLEKALFADEKDISGFEEPSEGINGQPDNMLELPLMNEDPMMSTTLTSEPFLEFLPPDSTVSDESGTQEEAENAVPDGYPAAIHSYTQQYRESVPPFNLEDAVEGDEIVYEDSEEESGEKSPEMATEVVVRRSQRPLKRKSLEIEGQDDDDDDQHVRSTKKLKKMGSSFSNGKKKLYTAGPFTDPEKEKCRINALNAKKNREKKKQERQKMIDELNRLKSENQVLKRRSIKMTERASNAEAELQRLRDLLSQNGLLLKGNK